MESPTHRTTTVPSDDALSAIQKEIEKLTGEQTKLRERREAVKLETLKSLADAFARKLQAAGFSVRDGIKALRPYEKINLDETPAPAVNSAATTAFRRAPAVRPAKPNSVRPNQINARDAVEQYANDVLGAQWQSWLETPHMLLGGERPDALLGHPAGVAKVRALLDAYQRST